MFAAEDWLRWSGVSLAAAWAELSSGVCTLEALPDGGKSRVWFERPWVFGTVL